MQQPAALPKPPWMRPGNELLPCGIPKLDLSAAETWSAIALCRGYLLPRPLLVLLYAWVDQLAEVDDCPAGGKTRARFGRWVETYGVIRRLNVAADDLYAARCGVIHSHSPESDLARSGKARRIMYTMGDARIGPSRKILKRKGIRDEYAALHTDELASAIYDGTRDFFAILLIDPVFRSRVSKRVDEMHFVDAPA